MTSGWTRTGQCRCRLQTRGTDLEPAPKRATRRFRAGERGSNSSPRAGREVQVSAGRTAKAVVSKASGALVLR